MKRVYTKIAFLITGTVLLTSFSTAAQSSKSSLKYTLYIAYDAVEIDHEQSQVATILTGEGHDMSGTSANTSNVKTEHATINVKGSCEMCKERIEKAAKAVNGVTIATWDQDAKQLHLNFESSKASIDIISKAVAKVGHDTDKYKADQATYGALPDCCKYR